MGSAAPDGGGGGGKRGCVRDATKSSYDGGLRWLLSETADGRYRERGSWKKTQPVSLPPSPCLIP